MSSRPISSLPSSLLRRPASARSPHPCHRPSPSSPANTDRVSHSATASGRSQVARKEATGSYSACLRDSDLCEKRANKPRQDTHRNILAVVCATESIASACAIPDGSPASSLHRSWDRDSSQCRANCSDLWPAASRQVLNASGHYAAPSAAPIATLFCARSAGTVRPPCGSLVETRRPSVSQARRDHSIRTLYRCGGLIATMLQLEPFQCSISGLTLAAWPAYRQRPSTFVPEPRRRTACCQLFPLTFGLATMLHCTPFQCSMSVVELDSPASHRPNVIAGKRGDRE